MQAKWSKILLSSNILHSNSYILFKLAEIEVGSVTQLVNFRVNGLHGYS